MDSLNPDNSKSHGSIPKPGSLNPSSTKNAGSGLPPSSAWADGGNGMFDRSRIVVMLDKLDKVVIYTDVGLELDLVLVNSRTGGLVIEKLSQGEHITGLVKLISVSSC